MGKNKQLRKEENRKAQQEASYHALTEYARKLEILQEQSSKLSSRISSTQRAQRVASLAISHIEQYGAETDKYFSQMGRAFLACSKEKVLADLERDHSEAQNEVPKLMETLNHFEKLKREQIDQITELKQQ